MIRAFQILTYVSGIFYYLSTTVNPLLYHIMSNKFREAFKKTYKQLCRKSRKVPGGRCYSSLSAPHQSNSDSYSGGGWGGTGSGSLRYLEDSVAARLHDHRRPLVVSFRRQKRAPMQDVIEVDADLAASRSSRGLSEICMARSSGSPNVIRRSDMKGFSYSPSAKLKNSFSFSSPLIMERLIIERSRSFAKDKQTPGNDLDGVLGSELRYRSETNNHPEVNQFGFDDRYRREVPKRSNCSFVEVHTLRPTHICPLSSKNKALEVQ